MRDRTLAESSFGHILRAPIERAAAARQAASSAHNEKETPLFAQSIERRALA